MLVCEAYQLLGILNMFDWAYFCQFISFKLVQQAINAIIDQFLNIFWLLAKDVSAVMLKFAIFLLGE